MRTSTVVMLAIAAVFGLLAVFVAQTWLARQAELRSRAPEPQQKPVAARTVVVAAQPLRFGNPLTAQALREVPWPEGAAPKGAFSSIAELIGSGKRLVIAAIEPNEPVLAVKITGPGQRATLSAVIAEGMKAATIRVNDVEGVAGFVLPGDRVDVLLTRQSDKTAATTIVVLQNVRVLAIDQLADDASDRPSIAKAVTLEVDTVAAQKVALAGQVGSLSLALRKAGEQAVEDTQRIALTDLSRTETPAAAPDGKRFATVTVTRANKREDYSVPAEGGPSRQSMNAANAGGTR